MQEQQGATVANLLNGLGLDEYFTRTEVAGARHFLTDALASTLALGDNAGAVQTTYTYEPFGMTTITGTATTNAFDYTSRENDTADLKYYRARYYHPGLQRFISEDPIGFDGGDINLYGYVWNEPISFDDPLGLFGLKDDCSYAGLGCDNETPSLAGRKSVWSTGLPMVELGIGGKWLPWLIDWRLLGPSAKYKKTGQGRFVGVVHRPTGVSFRIDYHPLGGKSSPPEWHFHFGSGEHNPLRIPGLPKGPQQP